MTRLFVPVLALSLPMSAFADECPTTASPGAIPAAGLVVLDSASTATATFCGGSAGYTSDVYLDDPSYVYIGTGHSTSSGSTVTLGAFTAGTELIFAIYVHNENQTYFTGPGSRNPDGIVHAAVTDLGGGAYQIGFEDLFGGGDLDYDDINIVVHATGVSVEVDTDDDTIPDDEDNCPSTPNTDQTDDDGDGDGNVCDECPVGGEDPDGDTVCVDDNCPTTANSDQADSDDDGAGDACDDCPFDADDDIDSDGVCGDVDNCVDDNNADQADSDHDGAGDVCDVCPNDDLDDSDNDGVCGHSDYCDGTVADVPTVSLGVNRWIWTGGTSFKTVSPKGKGPGRSYTIDDTAGCSCEQIADELALGDGHYKFGCSISAMDEWTLMMDEWIASQTDDDTGA
jgi:hypothetical protein